MKLDLKNKKVVIWGTGLDGVKTLYMLEQENIEIAYLINSNCKVETLKNYKVYEPSKEKIEGVYVVVSSSFAAYSVIANRLKEWGIEEFRDYCYYQWLYKDLVLIHGNCYMEYLEDVLINNVEFEKKYALYPNKSVHLNLGGEVSKEALKNIDVFIHQNISEQNPYSYKLSDAYMKQYIREDCKEIVFPNFVGTPRGFYPQCVVRKEDDVNNYISNGEDKNGVFPYGDLVVYEGIEKYDNLDDIIKYCNSDDILAKEEIENCVKEWIDKVKERETRWDIKIVDYILENYKDEQLFYDPGHPSDFLFAEMFNRVFDLLNINKSKEYVPSKYMDLHELPIYPYIKKVLGITWSKEYIRNGKAAKRLVDKMDLKEYIKEYAWWCLDKEL